MSFNISPLNGVTFGANTFAVTEVAQNTSNLGTNALGGVTDVVTGSTNSLTGVVDVAYVTYSQTGGTVTAAAQYTLGDGHYIAATSTTFATFGYIELSTGHGTYAALGQKEFVHGFSNGALLLSTNAVLTVDEVNGITTLTGAVGDNSHFAILSSTDLGIGSTSPIAGLPPLTTTPGGHYYVYLYDSVGIKHGRYGGYYNTPQGANPLHKYYNAAKWDNNPNPPTYPLHFSNGTTYTPPCFAEGTRILTARGEVLVEDLVVGDAALTVSGEARPVIWIGHRRVKVSGHPRSREVAPVRIRAGAFGERLPARDLRLSPGHAVYVEGVLIPAVCLVNGATIMQDEVERVRYFHVELESHDVLLAEGLPCESYLDDGNRSSFSNAGEAVALLGRLDPQSWDNAYAPWVGAGPQLAEANARLHARAESLGWRKVEEPDLHLLADGVVIEPMQRDGQRAWFVVPPCATLKLVSNAGVLAQLAPGLADHRRLGVAVSEVRVNGQPLPLDGAAFGAGFHPLETRQAAAWRWTDGEASLRLDLEAQAMVETTLWMVAPSWKRPAAQLRLVKAG